eukprot:5525371-Alexandrium_andersonii.AAC.1
MALANTSGEWLNTNVAMWVRTIRVLNLTPSWSKPGQLIKPHGAGLCPSTSPCSTNCLLPDQPVPRTSGGQCSCCPRPRGSRARHAPL